MLHPSPTNAFTVDFEDWYQGLEIPSSDWAGFEDRIPESGRRILSLLAEANVRGTFFVLGAVAERHPELIREIAAGGHEIGTHGWSHTLIYKMSPGRAPLRAETLHRASRGSLRRARRGPPADGGNAR